MCLIAFAFKVHPRYRLIVAANRDEFHSRPAEAMHWWPERAELLAGRDLLAGGTWLGISRSGRFAAVTNYREEFEPENRGRSRGDLVTAFVTAREAPLSWCRHLDGSDYRGFSLLTADSNEMACVSNRGDDARRLEPGIYGLSNASLDTPWTKVLRSKQALQALIRRDLVEPEQLFRLLGDREPAATDDYAGAGLAPGMARAISAPFIATHEYGTRCSTVLLVGSSGEVDICERRFDGAGHNVGESRFRFVID